MPHRDPNATSNGQARTTLRYSGAKTTTTNDQGHTRVTERNPAGLVVRVTDELGAQLVHQHDAFGHLVEVKDALGFRTRLALDIAGRKLEMLDPAAGRITYGYDALGQLRVQQNPKQRAAGTQSTLSYDALGRLKQRVDPEYTSTFTYDTCDYGQGLLCASSFGSGVGRSYAYDSLSRPIGQQVVLPGTAARYGFGLTYDANTGRLSSRTYPTGLRLSYNHAALGWLQSVSLATPLTLNPLPSVLGGAAGASTTLGGGTVLWRALERDATVALQRFSQGTGGSAIVTRHTLEAATGRLTAIAAGLSGTSSEVLDLRLGWDSLNRLRQRDSVLPTAPGAALTSVSEQFTPDKLGRLLNHSVARNGSPLRNTSTVYDPVGRILSKSDVGVYQYGDANNLPHAVRWVNGAGSIGFGYDANGNVTQASAGPYASLSYTSFNLPDAGLGATGPAQGGTRYAWSYDERQARVREVRSIAAGPQAGKLQRHYLSAEGISIGVLVNEAPLPKRRRKQKSPCRRGFLEGRTGFSGLRWISHWRRRRDSNPRYS